MSFNMAKCTKMRAALLRDREVGMTKLLIVDDEEAFCQLLKMNLEALGTFSVSYICDPRGAVDAAKTEKPDAVLLDLMMPHLEGTEVLRQLKADPETLPIPVFYLTALSDGIHTEDADPRSVRGVISKPVMVSDLVKKLNAALNRKPS